MRPDSCVCWDDLTATVRMVFSRVSLLCARHCDSFSPLNSPLRGTLSPCLCYTRVTEQHRGTGTCARSPARGSTGGGFNLMAKSSNAGESNSHAVKCSHIHREYILFLGHVVEHAVSTEWNLMVRDISFKTSNVWFRFVLTSLELLFFFQITQLGYAPALKFHFHSSDSYALFL